MMNVYIYEVVRQRAKYYLYQNEDYFSQHSFLKNFVAATIASYSVHLLHYAECRFILNNRIPGFGAY